MAMNKQDNVINDAEAGEDISRALFDESEKALQDTLEFHKVMMENIHLAVVLLTPEGKFIQVNEAFRKLFGYTDEDAADLTVARITAPEYNESSQRGIAQLVKGVVTVFDMEKEYLRKDGSRFWATTTATAVRNQDGSARFLTAFIHDLTKQRQAYLELAESEEKINSIFENLSDAVYACDVFGRIHFVNHAACQQSQYSRDELTSMHIYDIDAGSVDQKDQMRKWTKLSATEPISFETAHRRKDGSTLPVEVRLVKMSLHGEEIILGTARDIAERKKVETALQKSEERFKLAMEAANEGIWDLDVQTNQVYCSPGYWSILGYEPNATVRDNHFWEEMLHPDDRDGVLAVLDKSIADRRVEFSHEFRMRTKDGNWKWISSQGKAVAFDKDGRTIRILGTHVDITERIVASRKLEEAYRTSNDIVNSIPSGLFIFQYAEPEHLELISANPQAEILTGIKLKECKGKQFDEILPAARKLGITQKFLDVMRTQEIFETDDIYYADERLSGAFHILAFPLPGDRLAVAFENITDRKRSEEQLKEKTAELEQFFKSNLDMLCIADTEGHFLRLNQEWESVLGFPLEELEGRRYLDFVHPDDVSRTLQAMSELRSQEEVINFINRFRCKDGSFRYIEWRSSPAGQYIYAAARDITKRIKTEEILTNRTRELEALFLLSKELRAAQTRGEIIQKTVDEMKNLILLDGVLVNIINPLGTTYETVLADGMAAANLGKQQPIDSPIAQLVLQSPDIIYTNDYANFPQRSLNTINVEQMGPVAIVQIRSEVGALGAFAMIRKRGREEFSQENLHLFSAIGELVGNALRRSGLYEQAVTRLQQVQALHDVDMAISASLDQNFSLQAILGHTIRLMEVDAASILLLNPDTLALEYKAGYGFIHPHSFEGMSIRLGESIAGQVALKQVTVTVDDLPHQAEYVMTERLRQEQFLSMHAAPMMVKGQVIGVLQAFHRDICPHDYEKVDFLDALAAQAAIAVNNARMFSDLEKSNLELQLAYDATIEGWSLATDLRDKETEGHSLRVASLAVRLAELMGVSGKEIVHLRRGGLLHDIGKLAIPDSILFKPGPLDDDEWALMRLHPVRARDMLQRISFLKPALIIPLHHHEKYDGTGYPDGLSGEQIPLAARIFALIDVWDALTNDRPYRKAWTADQALAYIREQSGKHFDPQVVAVFLQHYERIVC